MKSAHVYKPAPTRVPIHDVIASRWSPRGFAAERPVAREQVLALLEAARWAPSCFGEQPWRYIVWDRFVDASAWEQAVSCLAPANQEWARHAPVLMVSLAATNFSANGRPNRWAQHDTGAASENICLQATALGLVAHQMGGFDADKTCELFGIPADYTPMAMIAVGYQNAAEHLSAEARARETAPRERRPLSEIAFDGAWGRAVSL